MIGWVIRRPAAAVFLLALVLRLAFVALLPADRLMAVGGDQGLYDRLGRSVAEGQGLSFRRSDAELKFEGNLETAGPLRDWAAHPDLHFGIAEVEKPSSVIPPLYPLFLGAVYRLAGPSYLAVRLLQALLGALAALAIFLAARACFGGDRTVALVAGAITALYPYLVYYTGILASENLYIPLLAFTAWMLLRTLVGQGDGFSAAQRGEREADDTNAVAVSDRGAESGADGETEGLAGRERLPEEPVAKAEVSADRPPAKRHWPSARGVAGRTLLFGLAFGLTFLARESILLFLPVALLLVVRFLGWRRGLVAAAAAVAAFVLAVSPWVARNYRVHGEFVLLTTKSGLNLWMRNHPEVIRPEFLAAGVGFPDGLAARLEKRELLEYPEMEGMGEVERNRLITRRAVAFILANPRYYAALCARRFLWLMSVTGGRARGLPFLLAGLVSYVPVLALGVAGAWLSWRRRVRTAWVPVLLILYTLGLHTLFHEGVRYRLPIDPFLGILAAYFAVESWRWLRGGSSALGLATSLGHARRRRG